MRPALALLTLTTSALALSPAHAQQPAALSLAALSTTTTPLLDSALRAADTLAAAHDPVTAQPFIIPAGGNLHLAITKGSRLTGKSQRVTATLTEPVYVGETLVFRRGDLVSGRVTAILPQPGRARVNRLLDGDLTPPRMATICFDQLTLTNGQHLPFASAAIFGTPQTRLSRYLNKQDRPGLKSQAKQQVHEALHQPNKLQHFTEAAIQSLPLHPEYIDEGTVYDAALLQPLTIPAGLQDTPLPTPAAASNDLHLRLLTAVDSETIATGKPLLAVLAQPYFDASHQLVYPAGLRLNGRVSNAASAGWLRKQGSVAFLFDSIQMPDDTSQPLHAVLSAVQAARYQDLAVSAEGGLRATTSRLAQVTAPLSLISPTRGVTDSSNVKTAWSRSGEGRSGFGLLGSGAAQASASTAVGFGYYGAAKRLYGAFIAKGENVNLPAGTPITLRLQDTPTFTKTQPTNAQPTNAQTTDTHTTDTQPTQKSQAEFESQAELALPPLFD